jgi:hypothetical protein
MNDKPKHSIVKLPTERADVFAFAIEGHVTTGEIDDVFIKMQEAYNRFGKVNLLVHIRHYEGFDWTSLFSQTTYVGKIKAFGHISRYAVVGGPSWVATAIKLFPPVFGLQMRHFEDGQIQQAWTWVYDDRERSKAA